MEIFNTAGLSTEKILLATLSSVQKCNLDKQKTLSYLDIGSGNGALIKLLSSAYDLDVNACDYTNKLMEIPNQQVDVCDLNTQNLPYNDEHFDLITMTEVVEHIENHRKTISEISRVLRPGGIAIISTPNILNLKSRIRFLFCGFWNLYGPLKIGNRKIESTGGHINPIHYFLLAHSVMEAGLTVKGHSFDKFQSSSIFLLLLLYFPIKILAFFHFRKENLKYKTIDCLNESFVKETNSTGLLLGRTVILTIEKLVNPR